MVSNSIVSFLCFQNDPGPCSCQCFLCCVHHRLHAQPAPPLITCLPLQLHKTRSFSAAASHATRLNAILIPPCIASSAAHNPKCTGMVPCVHPALQSSSALPQRHVFSIFAANFHQFNSAQLGPLYFVRAMLSDALCMAFPHTSFMLHSGCPCGALAHSALPGPACTQRPCVRFHKCSRITIRRT